MDKSLPDKYIRKAVSEAVNNIVVDGIQIPCYDTRVVADVNKDDPQHYILLTTQTATVDKDNKCEWFWDSSILIDVVTRYDMFGNTGSRLLADNIGEAVRDVTNNLVLEGGFNVVTQTILYPADLSSETKNEIIFRKLIRLELLIK